MEWSVILTFEGTVVVLFLERVLAILERIWIVVLERWRCKKSLGISIFYTSRIGWR